MQRRAFTLIELMISIALVLILIIGINQVFSITSQTVGAGQAQSSIVRDVRAVQAIFNEDFKSMANESTVPLIIRNQRLAAFRNRADQLSDRDYDPSNTEAATDDKILTIDLDGNNVEGEVGVDGEIIPRTLYGNRNFRIDQMNFFVRGLFRRQTGNDGTFAAPMTSSEAWVWIGHLKRNGTSGTFADDKFPGYIGSVEDSTADDASDNPDNFYAQQWILGRMQMLLREPDSSGNIFDENGVEQRYIRRKSSTGLAPLAQHSQVDDATSPLIQWGRYDLAGTTISSFTQILKDYIDAGNTTWVTGGQMLYRFQGNPFLTRPMTSEGMARTTPCLLPACTSFIIEFAGDFVKQNRDPNDNDSGGTGDAAGRYGWVQDTCLSGSSGTDGEIDFIVDSNGARRIRWYGYPRDVTGDRSIPGRTTAGSGNNNNQLTDVVPLRDVIRTAPGQNTFNPPVNGWIERELPDDRLEYVSTTLAYNSRYTVAWGPDTASLPRPKLIRFVITMDDPAGRLPAEQTFEFVFNLP